MGADGDGAPQGSRTGAKLVGFANFTRSNPRSDRFAVRGFHSVEFWCADAATTARRFSGGLGMRLSAKSDLSTGNHEFASLACRSGELVFAFTAPYGDACAAAAPADAHGKVPLPGYDRQRARDFIARHGLAVRAVGVEVEDAREAFARATANGAVAVLAPAELGGGAAVAEVKLYGDVVMRLVSGVPPGTEFLPGYEPLDTPPLSFGIERLDHAVGNVPNLLETVDYIMGFTGFHEFAEFTAEDVGTVDSGLNSMVLACNNEMVLLPVNEPTFGTRRKSQIQTYLEQNEGPGLQHLALKTNDIFATLRQMRARSADCGFDFMAPASEKYYANLPAKIGDVLTPAQYAECKELGILVDKDDQGVLLQIFTKPLGDRPTVFIEIIQRVGCIMTNEQTKKEEQAAGCGGFGKGNFSELFKSIEDYERTLEV